MTQDISDRPSSVAVPHTVLIGVALAVIGCLFGSGVYTGRLSANQENGAAAFEKFKTEIFTPYQKTVGDRFDADESRAAAGSGAAADMNAKLARIQGQLEFIINTMPPNTGSRK